MTTARTERALQDIAAYLRSIDKSLGDIAKYAKAATVAMEDMQIQQAAMMKEMFPNENGEEKP